MRANVYSLTPLPKTDVTAIHNGLEQVAAYIGEPITVRDLTVRVPTTPDGLVVARNIGFGALDPLVELHVMAVPFAGVRSVGLQEGGISRFGTGTCCLNTAPLGMSHLFTTTRHEAGHGLGFVPKDSPQHNSGDLGHCVAPTCIMSREYFEDGQLPAGAAQYLPSIQTQQVDFCAACKTDLRNLGLSHIEKLRADRASSGRI